MQEYAEIFRHIEYDPELRDYKVARYEWVGDPSLPIKIDQMLDQMGLVSILPWDLELIQKGGFNQGFNVYIRKDAGLSYIYHRFRADWDRYVLRSLRFAGVNLLLLAESIGLADCPKGEYASIYHLNWMSRNPHD